MIETWKPVVGYEGLYEVSDQGKVRSLPRNTTKGKTLKSSSNGHGYQHLVLTKNGNQKDCYIHRLVAAAFIPNPNNLTEVNHKDEDKTNNRVENLEWCTKEYNYNYGTRTERSKTNQHAIAITNGEEVFSSAAEASQRYKVGRTAINNCLKGRSKTCCGFSWSYVSNSQG